MAVAHEQPTPPWALIIHPTRCPPPHGTDPMPDVAIKVDQVKKIYGTRTVLDSICLEVRQGETLVILGGSGSGKSTLLRLMIGNIPYDGGDILGLGKSLGKMTECELSDYRKCIGVLFQSAALFNSMSVAAN